MSTIPKSVALTGLLIAEVTRQTLPAETLDYDSLSFKPLSTWESRVSASIIHSFIWTQIPASLKTLRGSTSPVRNQIRQKFPDRKIFAHEEWSRWQDYRMDLGHAMQQVAPGQRLRVFPPPFQQPSSASRRGFLGGVLGRLGF